MSAVVGGELPGYEGSKGDQMNQESAIGAETYERPELGPPQLLTAVTLFSGTVDPDAGVIEFGQG